MFFFENPRLAELPFLSHRTVNTFEDRRDVVRCKLVVSYSFSPLMTACLLATYDRMLERATNPFY